MRSATLFLVASLSITACEKQDGLPPRQASGALPARDASLLAYLPKDVAGVAGGNYGRLQDMMGSGMSALMEAVDQTQPGIKAYSDCWMKKVDAASANGLAMVMGVRMSGAGIEMMTVMRGVSIDDVAACAELGKQTVTRDPDGRGVTMIVGGVPSSMLVLPDGAIYTRQSMQLSFGAKPRAATRADLEADIAARAQGSAADRADLLQMIAQVNRRHTTWIAADLAGTPLAGKAKRLFGSFDLASTIKIDVTVELASDKDADEVRRGVAQLRANAAKAPAKLRGVVDRLKIGGKAAEVRAVMSLSQDELSSLVALMPMAALGGKP